jgi:hypothetical protein
MFQPPDLPKRNKPGMRHFTWRAQWRGNAGGDFAFVLDTYMETQLLSTICNDCQLYYIDYLPNHR